MRSISCLTCLCLVLAIVSVKSETLLAQSLPDTVWVDVNTDLPFQSAVQLQDRFLYTVEIDGTFSIWNTWGGGSCGDFQGVPRYASPGVLNGPVGVDAAFIFAAPLTTAFCAGALPSAQGDFLISTDDGQSWFNPRPIADTYSTEHTYTYEIRGFGHPIQAFFSDDPYEDNYGLMRIVILSAVPVSSESEQKLAGFTLGQNYPNPANRTTVIPLQLAQPDWLILEVRDILGRTVFQSKEGFREAGPHRLELDTTVLPNGLYLYTIRTSQATASRQFLVNR